DVFHIGHTRGCIDPIRDIALLNDRIRIIAYFYFYASVRFFPKYTADTRTIVQVQAYYPIAWSQSFTGSYHGFQQLFPCQPCRHTLNWRSCSPTHVIIGVTSDALRGLVSEKRPPA